MKRVRLALVLLLLCAVQSRGAEVIPPKPAGYFNDYAGVVSKDTALRFNEQLAQFERETSNQLVVAVFPKMESDSSIEDYGQRIAQAWGVGQKDRSRGNGVALLVFVQDRKISLQVGYGLEGVLPDVTAFDIRTRHINPYFRKGDYAGGLAEGIDLICKALKGEYTGTGKTDLEENGRARGGSWLPFVIFVIILLVVVWSSRKGGRRGWGYTGAGGPFIGGWSGGGSGGSSSGGGFSGFSGGGGSFGGGGSSGGW